jgi:hypothetical protein
MGQGLTPKELLDAHIQICGKMQLIHLMMPILKSLGWRVLIFSQVHFLTVYIWCNIYRLDLVKICCVHHMTLAALLTEYRFISDKLLNNLYDEFKCAFAGE